MPKVLVPLKTRDVVKLSDGKHYLVNNVQMTKGGPIVEVLPIKMSPSIVHASECTLINDKDKQHRTKSVLGRINQNTNNTGRTKSVTINIPEGIDAKDIEKALAHLTKEQ